jgi:hypothetical protein
MITLRPATMGKDAPTEAVVLQYEELVERLHAGPDGKGWDGMVLHFDDGAQAIRQRLEQKHLDLMQCVAVNKKLAAHIGKYDGLFARLCVLWHCIECVSGREYVVPYTVTEQTAQRVAEFLHAFLLSHAVAFYVDVLGLADSHDRLTAVAGYILARKLEVVTNRTIQQGDRTMRGLDRKDILSVFDHLSALGWIEWRPGPRPSSDPHWYVNPKCHQLFQDRAKREAERRTSAREEIAALISRRKGE